MREIRLSDRINGSRRIETPIIQSISLSTIAEETGIDVTSDVTPRMPRMLKMFEPIMFATATSVRPRNAATSDVANSGAPVPPADRKSTRLNSSHGYISYAVFCLKKKKQHK